MIAKRMTPYLVSNKESLERYNLCQQDAFHPNHNPQGYINLAIAENYLVWDLVKACLGTPLDLKESDAHYQDLHGKYELRTLLAAYLSHRSSAPISGDDLIVTPGATAALEMLAFALCDPGDVLLIPAPFYAGFSTALQTRTGVDLKYLVVGSDEGYMPTTAKLKAAVGALKNEGKRLKAIVLNSPHNPTGRMYPQSLLENIAKLCRQEDLHLIADELYMESYFPGGGRSSALSLASEHVHTVYGLSKDFGLSGLAVGILHTRHPKIKTIAKHLTRLGRVSNHTQNLVQALFSDPEKVDACMDQYRARLANACRILTEALNAAQIPYLAPEGGILVFLDLSRCLNENSRSAEEQLQRDIFEHCRLNLAAGALFNTPTAGWFRLCYAVDEAKIRTSIRRLADYLKKHSAK